MDGNFDDLAHEVAHRLEPDVPYLQPAGETHFVGEAALIALGSTVVLAFAKGVLAAAADEAEQWGNRSFAWIKDKVAAAFSGEQDAPDVSSETIEIVTEYRRVIKTATGDQLASWSKSSSITLEMALVENELPAHTARRAVEAAKAL